MDTTKIAPGIIQYTAVDDCSRYSVLAVYSRRSGANTLLFLDQVVEEMPFPIRRIQTDRGRDFFRHKSSRKDDGVRNKIQTQQTCATSFEWQS